MQEEFKIKLISIAFRNYFLHNYSKWQRALLFKTLDFIYLLLLLALDKDLLNYCRTTNKVTEQ